MIAPREGKWTAKPLKTRVGYWTLHWGASMIYVVCAMGCIFSHPHMEHMPPWISELQSGATLLILIYYFASEVRARRLTRKDALSMDRPEGLDEYPVEMTITVNGGDFGSDRGVVYFDEGLLGFVGGRTSFLIATEDLVFTAGKVLNDLDAIYKPLTLKATGGKASVTIRPLLGFGRAYRRSLKRFLREKRITIGPRQLPPLTTHSETEVDVPAARRLV